MIYVNIYEQCDYLYVDYMYIYVLNDVCIYYESYENITELPIKPFEALSNQCGYETVPKRHKLS